MPTSPPRAQPRGGVAWSPLTFRRSRPEPGSGHHGGHVPWSSNPRHCASPLTSSVSPRAAGSPPPAPAHPGVQRGRHGGSPAIECHLLGEGRARHVPWATLAPLPVQERERPSHTPFVPGEDSGNPVRGPPPPLPGSPLLLLIARARPSPLPPAAQGHPLSPGHQTPAFTHSGHSCSGLHTGVSPHLSPLPWCQA